jgi:lambda family phage portal protein
MKPQHWTDRAAAAISPTWALRRVRARAAMHNLRHYEAASTGRRTANWYRTNTDANAALGPALAYLRATARDLVRNNGYAESALSTIVDHMIGTGIVAKLEPQAGAFAAAWKQWSETTECDADGRHDLAGLEALVARTVAESGECLVRRRWRESSDGFALNFQLQILEPDHLDVSKEQVASAKNNAIVQGVEFDGIGRRVAYWLFREHPGSNRTLASGASYRVPVSDVRHVFRATRPGQVRAASWFAPVLLTFKDFDEFDDATIMKQKIAACLAVVMSDVDGSGAPLGTADDTENPGTDTLSPGAIIRAAAGQNIEVVQPPSVSEFGPYSTVTLRKIATGLGIGYEDLTGDYTGMSFSAARMSRLRHWARVDGWRWKMMVPQFCTPVAQWAIQVGRLQGLIPAGASNPAFSWTAPPPPMIEPDKEGLAIQRMKRIGAKSLSESIREMGYDPERVFAELESEDALLKKLGLVLDSDPRVMTQAGQAQGAARADAALPPADESEEDAERKVFDFLHDIGPERAAQLMRQAYGG